MKKNKMTYAQAADKLTKKIGELEEKAKSSDRFAKETAKQMLPKYQAKLDKLYQAQEASKQAELAKVQMKYGGYVGNTRTREAELEPAIENYPKLELGGDIAAGAVGVVGGALGTIPIAGDMLQNGLYNLHGKIDKDLTAQEQSIRGFGQAAGAITAGAITGNVPGAIGETAEGLGTGINAGTNNRYAGIVDPLVGAAGMAGNFMAYGGKLPKMQLGGSPYPVIQQGETWPQYMQRATALGFNDHELLMHYNTVMSNPDNNISTQTSESNINPVTAQANAGARDERFGEFVSPEYNTYGDPKAGMAQGNPNAAGAPNAGVNPNNAGGGVTGASQGSGVFTPSFKGDNPYMNALYTGMAYAPTVYNTIRGLQKPQNLESEDFQNPYESQAMNLMANRRYNIDPQLDANRSSFNATRSSLQNAAAGNASAYLSNVGKLQLNRDRSNAQAYATKQNMDNQYMAQDAQMRANLGNARASRELQIQDINDRNKAARDAHLGKAVEGMSGIAQNQQLMNNMYNADQQRILAMNNMFMDYGYSTDDQGRITGINYKG